MELINEQFLSGRCSSFLPALNFEVPFGGSKQELVELTAYRIRREIPSEKVIPVDWLKIRRGWILSGWT